MVISHEDIAEQLKESLENKEEFWKRAAEKLVWTKKWTKVLDDSNSPYTKWFVGGETNLCYNCLDIHVESGRGDKVLFIHESPITQTRTSCTYKETLDKVSRIAGLLRKCGVEKGDVVLVYFPMIPEAAFAMLACARIGAIHAGIPSGLPAKDLAQRIDLSQPKVVILGSHGYHGTGWMNYKAEVDAACDLAKNKPQNIIVYQRENQDIVSLMKGRDIDWRKEVVNIDPVPCVPIEANEASFIVYTSGSTGLPKAILHSGISFAIRWANDGPTFCEDDDVFFGTSNFGWIVGLSCIVYGPALMYCKTIIFEGDTFLSEDARVAYRTIQDNKVTTCFIRPGLLKVIKGMDPEGKIASEYKFDSLKNLWFAGERTDMSTAEWARKNFQASVWNLLGQSEIASAIYGAPDSKVSKAAPIIADFGMILPGFDIHLLTPEGKEANINESGRILARLPLPPGAFIGVHNNNEAFLKYFSEFPGYYDTCDEGIKNEEGYLKAINRADDIMKVGLYYIAAPAVEEVVMKHGAIQECVVVSTTDLIWKEIPVILYVKKKGVTQSKDDIEKELKGLLVEEFGPSVHFGRCVQIEEMPVTRTGKAHRSSCKSMVRGQEIKAIGGVENPHVFADIIRELKAHGYGKNVLLD